MVNECKKEIIILYNTCVKIVRIAIYTRMNNEFVTSLAKKVILPLFLSLYPLC